MDYTHAELHKWFQYHWNQHLYFKLHPEIRYARKRLKDFLRLRAIAFLGIRKFRYSVLDTNNRDVIAMIGRMIMEVTP